MNGTPSATLEPWSGASVRRRMHEGDRARAPIVRLATLRCVVPYAMEGLLRREPRADER